MVRLSPVSAERRSGIGNSSLASRTRLPNFLVIGAAKAASSSLHHYLGQHPDIYMSPNKEPNYFSFDGPTPLFRYPPECEGKSGAVRARVRNATLGNRIPSLEQYRQLFAKATSQHAVGESSVNYLYSEAAPGLIKALIPDVRMVAILRNPVDRAYSRFLHARRDGLEPLADFAVALAAEKQRIAEGYAPAWHYRARGYYHQQLQRYYRHFDRKRIHIMLYDDFCAAPQWELRALFNFLEVDPCFVPDMSQQINVSGQPRLVARSWLLDHLLNQSNPLKTCAKRLLRPAALHLMRRVYVTCNSKREATPQYGPLPQAMRRQLQEDFKSDILKLQDLINRDLSRWLR